LAQNGVIKLKAVKLNLLRVLSLAAAIFFIFTFIAGLSGCRSTDVSASESIETVQEEPATTGLDEKEAIEAGSAATTEKEDIITDNINIFSGLEISDKVNSARPIAIMVQNNPKARPHSGLIYADMIFEMVAEGGVTRFITVFSSYDAEIIGPVRSARIYFAEIARSLDPIFTFWGSYPGAYDAIKKMDMDVFDANSTAYVNYTSAGWRDPGRSNELEHTAFIDTYGIKKDAEKFGYSLEGGQSPMAFKLDSPEVERGSITEINVNFSSESYGAGFKYDKNTNKYLKWLAGSPHTDYETGQQLSLNNVIVLITDIEGPIDQSGHMFVRNTGTYDEGEAYYFMDGNVTEGTWARQSIFEPFEFKDLKGEQIFFNRGQTWICIIQSINRLNY